MTSRISEDRRRPLSPAARISLALTTGRDEGMPMCFKATALVAVHDMQVPAAQRFTPANFWPEALRLYWATIEAGKANPSMAERMLEKWMHDVERDQAQHYPKGE